MANSSGNTKAVGSIPTAALNAITDPNIRSVLQTLVDGWNVRNGNTGTGDNQFVTRADLGMTTGASGGIVAQQSSQVASQTPDFSDPTVAQVNRIITDIQAQVMNSELFQALGARVNLIDKPTTGILTQLGNVVTGIATETTNRTNADNAILLTVNTQYASVNQSLALVQQQVSTVSNAQASQASTLNQVQANVGKNSTAIAQETTARVTADGELFAQYTVKIDQNGYGSGFGLASTAYNARPTSAFLVRADSFAIASPSGPGIVPQVPFVVYTTPTAVGGEIVQPGVYVASAMIANGTIGTAQIGQASIDTLRLQGQAVSLNRWFVGYNTHIPKNGSATVIDVYVDFPANSAASMLFFRYTVLNPTAALSMTAQIWWNNQLVTQEGSSVVAGMSTQITTMCQVTPNQGPNHFQCVAYSPGAAEFDCVYPNLALIGAKR